MMSTLLQPQQVSPASGTLTLPMRRGRRATAHHEAGHAIVALHFGAEIIKIFLDDSPGRYTGKRSGQCDFCWPCGAGRNLEFEDAVVLLSGPIAGARAAHRSAFISVAFHPDYYFARALVDEQGFENALVEAKGLVRKNWGRISELAAELLERRVLFWDEIHMLAGGSQ